LFAVRDDGFAGGREDVMPVGDVRRALMCVELPTHALSVSVFLYLNPVSELHLLVPIFITSAVHLLLLTGGGGGPWGILGRRGIRERVVKRQLTNESEMLTSAPPTTIQSAFTPAILCKRTPQHHFLN
jgi:hypothetical protein